MAALARQARLRRSRFAPHAVAIRVHGPAGAKLCIPNAQCPPRSTNGSRPRVRAERLAARFRAFRLNQGAREDRRVAAAADIRLAQVRSFGRLAADAADARPRQSRSAARMTFSKSSRHALAAPAGTIRTASEFVRRIGPGHRPERTAPAEGAPLPRAALFAATGVEQDGHGVAEPRARLLALAAIQVAHLVARHPGNRLRAQDAVPEQLAARSRASARSGGSPPRCWRVRRRPRGSDSACPSPSTSRRDRESRPVWIPFPAAGRSGCPSCQAARRLRWRRNSS